MRWPPATASLIAPERLQHSLQEWTSSLGDVGCRSPFVRSSAVLHRSYLSGGSRGRRVSGGASVRRYSICTIIRTGPSEGPYIGHMTKPTQRKLDRTIPLPLWAQLLEDLRRRLASGEFENGFPAERELIEQYEISRHTMRDAMRRLNNEGLISRERGRGTFVRKASIEQRVGTLYSLFRSIEDQGFEQRSKVLGLEELPAPEIARQLGLRSNTKFVYLHRLRYANDAPIATDELWLPSSLAAPLLRADFDHTAVYAELDQRCNIRPGAGWERVHPVIPTADERSLLQITSKQAAFLVERYTEFHGRPLEWRRTVIRGDLYTFSTAWNDAGEQTDQPTFAPAAESRA